MDKILILVLNSALVLQYALSAPQYRSQHQSGIYPSYFYQQLPFIYNPYPNPFFMYNYVNSFPPKFTDTKSEPDQKNPLQPESQEKSNLKVEAKSSHPGYQRVPFHWQHQPHSQPIFPFFSYPQYGRNLDSWTATEIPVTVIVDDEFEKSYNVPYTLQNPYVRNYVELSKQNPPLGPVQQAPSDVKSSNEQTERVQVRPFDKTQFVQGAPLIPNVAGISTPQASISFFQQPVGYGRDLGNWNVNEIPISAIVVDEGVADKNSEKEVEKPEEKADEKISNPASPVISPIQSN